MGIYQTSSPSYILMASMDACMDKLRKDGQQMFREFTFNLEKARQRLSKCKKIKLIEGSMIEGSRIYEFDRSKLLFSTVGTSVNGHFLHQILRDRYHIEMEMAAEKYVLGIAAVGDTEEGFERLCTAIEEIDAEIQLTDESEEVQSHTSHARMTQLMTIFSERKCWQSQCRVCLSVSARNSDYCAGRADNWTICKKCEKIHGTGAGSTGTQ